MCKPRRQPHAAQAATGATTRLGEGEYLEPSRETTAHWRPGHGRHFPWWTLWLIWPLIGLGKAVAPAVIGALGALSQVSIPLLPVLLIVIGVALLIARRRDR